MLAERDNGSARCWPRPEPASCSRQTAPGILPKSQQTLSLTPEVHRYLLDADQGNYVAYYERLVGLVRAGGIICVDDTLTPTG